MISAFELFKIGIGPSSSHTMGPMIAAKRFRDELTVGIAGITVELFGSLAWTGRGHGSDTAIYLGLLGEIPCSVDPDAVPEIVKGLCSARGFRLNGRHIAFDPERDIVMDLETLLPLHSNAMRFRARGADGSVLLEKVFYSIGGGFVLEA